MEPIPKSKIPAACVPRDVMLRAAMVRLGDVSNEIQEGYNILRKYHKTVTIFGSARLTEESEYYHRAVELAERLVEHKFSIITGGGHGIMGAANKGAREAGGDSIGFNIHLPHEQTLNDYTTEAFAFAHFAPRKIVMTLFANAYVYFPGGFGTLDELSEILTLVQTGKTNKAPIILFGSEFWGPFDDFVQNTLLTSKVISPGDEKLYMITDSVDVAVETILDNQTYCDHVYKDPDTPRAAKSE